MTPAESRDGILAGANNTNVEFITVDGPQLRDALAVVQDTPGRKEIQKQSADRPNAQLLTCRRAALVEALSAPTPESVNDATNDEPADDPAED